MKTIWVTSLGHDEETAKRISKQLGSYGLAVKGHFWEDDIEKSAWAKPRTELLDPKIELWAILGSDKELSKESIRYGLSLLCIAVKAGRTQPFPVVYCRTGGGTPVDSELLPTPLKGLEAVSAADGALGAKLVAKIHGRKAGSPPPYRLDVYGNAQIGQWFEVGGVEETWSGGLFGVSGGEITFHAVGPKGRLPDKSVLHYPSKGLRLQLAEREYTGWAVRNELDAATSYYVKVQGAPDSIVFGPFPESDEAELYRVTLK